jgi:hypothetical protein
MLLGVVVSSVEIEWHGGHSAARCFTFKIARDLYWYLITWDRAWPLGWKWRPSVGKVGEWFVKSQHLQDYSPRLCQLRTDGLARVSKYWTYWSYADDMDPVCLVACSSIEVRLKRTTSMVMLGEKLRRVPRATQPGWEVESGALFQEQWICPTLLGQRERLPRMRTTRRKHTRVVRGLAWEAYMLYWSGFPMQGVHQFKSTRLSDMSNRLSLAIFT